MEVKRGFLGIWIPAEIWNNSQLSLLEKCLYSEIESLSKELGYCYASNKYFADFFGVKETYISTCISNLINKGYVKLVHFDGRVRKVSVTYSYKHE